MQTTETKRKTSKKAGIATTSDSELLWQVSEFRKGILGKRSPRNMCYAVCAALEGYLNFIGTDAWMVEGEVHLTPDPPEVFQHFWLELPDGRILDPTASQFVAPDGSMMPQIYLGKKPSHYKNLEK